MLDPKAVGGSDIRALPLERLAFDSRPQVHAQAVRLLLQLLYDQLQAEARDDGRLIGTAPLIQRWHLTYDIYSPRLRRFVEVDELQHFSRPRLSRLQGRRREHHPLYPDYFWEQAFPELLASPRRDPDGKCRHRDEQRAYLDEAR